MSRHIQSGLSRAKHLSGGIVMQRCQLFTIDLNSLAESDTISGYIEGHASIIIVAYIHTTCRRIKRYLFVLSAIYSVEPVH